MKIPETLKMPSLCGLGKKPQGIFGKQSTLGFFGFESSFQNWLWIVFSTSGLSQICKIRNVWKLPSPFSRNTRISWSEKTSWNLKTSFWKKNCPVISKTLIKKISTYEISKQEVPKPKKPLRLENFHDYF
jgi:hypothetical protein